MATTKIPEQFMDLFDDETKAFAYVATVMPDGTPQVTPVWFDFVDGKLRFNTARGRVKDKNLTRDPNVAIAIADPKNPYRHIQIRGRVTATEEGARDNIDRLAKKYLGQDKYPMYQGETRVIYVVEPTSIATMG